MWEWFPSAAMHAGENNTYLTMWREGVCYKDHLCVKPE